MGPSATRVWPRGNEPTPRCGESVYSRLALVRTGAFRKVDAVLLLLTMIIGIAIVLAAILSAGEDQRQRERRIARDLDMKR